jgi:hypothetical protein
LYDKVKSIDDENCSKITGIVSLLKHLTFDKHKTNNSPRVDMSLKHIILIPSLFLLLLSYVLRREAAKAIFLVFGLTQPGLKFTNYHTQGERFKIAFVTLESYPLFI